MQYLKSDYDDDSDLQTEFISIEWIDCIGFINRVFVDLILNIIAIILCINTYEWGNRFILLHFVDFIFFLLKIEINTEKRCDTTKAFKFLCKKIQNKLTDCNI